MKSILTLLAVMLTSLSGKVVTYELTVSETIMAPAGKNRRALTLNDGIPGPTLRFRVGDTARINVRNHLIDEDTSIHWHGILLPNAMDGVPYLTCLLYTSPSPRD